MSPFFNPPEVTFLARVVKSVLEVVKKKDDPKSLCVMF